MRRIILWRAMPRSTMELSWWTAILSYISLSISQKEMVLEPTKACTQRPRISPQICDAYIRQSYPVGRRTRSPCQQARHVQTPTGLAGKPLQGFQDRIGHEAFCMRRSGGTGRYCLQTSQPSESYEFTLTACGVKRSVPLMLPTQAHASNLSTGIMRTSSARHWT